MLLLYTFGSKKERKIAYLKAVVVEMIGKLKQEEKFLPCNRYIIPIKHNILFIYIILWWFVKTKKMYKKV